MIHAENSDAIGWLTGTSTFYRLWKLIHGILIELTRKDKLEARGMVQPYFHALSRPPLVEGEATNRAVALATLIQNPLLFVHVGSSVSMIRRFGCTM